MQTGVIEAAPQSFKLLGFGQMPKDSRNFSVSLIDSLIDHRKTLVAIIVVISVFMLLQVPNLELDHSLEAVYDKNSPEYKVYRRFVDTFGHDQFILFAIKNTRRATDPIILKSVDAATRELIGLKQLSHVDSIANLQVLESRKEKFGSYPLIHRTTDELFVDEQELHRLRKIWSPIDLLVSKDLMTVGVMVLFAERYVFGEGTGALIEEMKRILRRNFPADSELHVVGTPVWKEAVLKYNVQTALTFGIASLLVGVLVQFYIFKNPWIPVLVFGVSGLAILWGVGLMASLGIRLNSLTALAFGFVIIFTTATVIHIVTHFNSNFRNLGDRLVAMKSAVNTVAKPCLMCSITTAAGFATLMVSSVPSVKQFGMLMSLGAILSFVVAMTAGPSILLIVKPPGSKKYARMDSDLLSLTFNQIRSLVFKQHRLLLLSAAIFVVVMVAGIPLIKTDTRLLSMFSETTPEFQDFRFIEQNLVSPSHLSLVLEAPKNTFKASAGWQRVKDLEAQMKKLPDVDRIDSLLPVLENMWIALASTEGKTRDLLENPKAIPELISLMKWSDKGRRVLSSYVSQDFAQTIISLRLSPHVSNHLPGTVEKLRQAANAELVGVVNADVTGHLALAASQSQKLIRTQFISLFLALLLIIILLMIQFRSLTIGMLSLIPNLFPLAVIFGIMGWSGIPLDSMTVLVAVVCFGFSVDDTIHYLTHVRRELGSKTASRAMERCLERAYNKCARALISTSAVFFFGFLPLLWGPFKPSAAFGALASSAAVAALAGDIVVMPALILSSRKIAKALLGDFPLDQSRAP